MILIKAKLRPIIHFINFINRFFYVLFLYVVKFLKLTRDDKKYLRYWLFNDITKRYLNTYTLNKKMDEIIPHNNINIKLTIDEISFHYINLSHRKDRNNSIIKEFESNYIKRYKRFNAIKDTDGLKGCVLSHLQVLKKIRDANICERVIVCEDDILLIEPKDYLMDVVNNFLSDDNLDVLCLGYNVKSKIHYNDFFYLTNDTQTTSAYMLKISAIDSIIKSFQISKHLLDLGFPRYVAALDITWKEKQKKLNFVLPKKRIVKQLENSFSDIENKFVKYDA